MTDKIDLLSRLYEHFNARNVEGVFAALDDGVAWANGMDGGYVHGTDALRDYWTRQWSQVSPRVDPLSFRAQDSHTVVAVVQQSLFDLSGRPLEVQGGLHSQVVHHAFTFENGRIVRFDIVPG